MKKLFLKMLINIFLMSLFLICSIFYSGCGKAEKESVIALINGKEVAVDLLEDYFFENLNGNLDKSGSKGVDQTEDEINKVKSRLLEDFIDEQLLFEQAEKASMTVDDEEKLGFLRELGESIETISELDDKKMRWIKNLLIIQKFKREKVFSDISVSELELKEYFHEQMKERSDHRRFLLGIIVLELEKEAQKILKNIKARKADFDTLTEKYGMIPEKAGPQIYFLDELPENIREEVARLKKGEISKVLPLLGRFCIIKMEGVEKAGARPFDEISEELKMKIIREKEEIVFEEYIYNLRKNSEIKIFYKRLPFTFIAEKETG